MSISQSMIIGAACLVWWRDAIVLEVQQPGKWRTDDRHELHIGIGGIGGGIEPGETAVAALQREALEEMGCRIELRDVPINYAVSPDCRVLEEKWRAPGIRPAFVWDGCLPGLVPGRKVAVFRGSASSAPTPGDLPALLHVTPEIMLAIGRSGMRLAEALRLGAVLHAQTTLPESAWLELVGTPAVVSLLHIQGEPLTAAWLEPA